VSDLPQPPLDRAGLQRRRREQARLRRRRRLVALGSLVLVVAVITAVLTSRGGGHDVSLASAHTVAHTAPVHTNAAHQAPVASTRTAAAAALHRTMAANGYVVRGTPRRKLVALTFDDGPGPSTQDILGWLTAHRVPATFFLIGQNAKTQPALVRAELAAGDVVGDHTESHTPLAGLSAVRQQLQIEGGAQAIKKITHEPVTLFRPPEGSFDATTLELLRRDGLLMVLWTVDTKDYSMPGTDKIVYTALSGARAGTIVLMHDGGGDRSQTLAALPRIVHHLRLKGYKLVTIPELLIGDPVPADQPTPSLGSGLGAGG
jgi:peptidoglycan/xylan/chitin deacetylase (PgdA/CDA1 family)